MLVTSGSWKGKETGPVEPLERNASDSLILSQKNLYWTLTYLLNYKILNLCCFKPPSLWEFAMAAIEKQFSAYHLYEKNINDNNGTNRELFQLVRVEQIYQINL